MNLVINANTIKYGTLSVEKHGGYCCGRFHLHDFPFVHPELNAHPEAAEKKKTYLLSAMTEGAELLWDEYGPYDDETGERGPFYLEDCSYCAKAVLVEHQRQNWEQALFDCGFELVEK